MFAENRPEKPESAQKRFPLGAVCIIAALTWSTSAGVVAADRLVLRNLKIISDRQVSSWNEDGVKLDNGDIVTWDAIERGSVDKDKQAQFNKMLKELGGPLFQIRQRLIKGDYEGLSQPVEKIYPRYQSRSSKTAYMVLQSLMWSRLAGGQRESAVEPYLFCYEYLKTHNNGDDNLPGQRRLKYDPATALSSELPPIWFEPAEAKKALPLVFAAVKKMQRPTPIAARIYYGTLAMTAGDAALGARFLEGIKSESPAVIELRDIALAQQEAIAGTRSARLARLEASLDSLSPANKPLALYWLGTAKTADPDEQIRRRGVLQLLYLPALHGEQYPELAGAALYRSMKVLDDLGDPQDSVKLRKELLVRYGQTIHAAKLKAGTPTTKTPMR